MNKRVKKANRAGLDVGTVQFFVSVKNTTHSGFFVRLVSSIVSVQVGISPPSTPLLVTARHHHSVAPWFMFCCFVLCFFSVGLIWRGVGESPWAFVSTLRFSRQILKKEEAIPWPGTLAIVHSYIAYKEGESEPLGFPPPPPPRPPKHWAVSPSLPLSLLQLKKRRNRS